MQYFTTYINYTWEIILYTWEINVQITKKLIHVQKAKKSSLISVAPFTNMV